MIGNGKKGASQTQECKERRKSDLGKERKEEVKIGNGQKGKGKTQEWKERRKMGLKMEGNGEVGVGNRIKL